MTSEVENILNGEVVRKVNADKAIGISSANLLPDEKGEVPLSKQSAFEMAPVEAPVAAEPTAPVMPEVGVGESMDLTPA